MDSILKAFSIGFLLRSIFSGIFFVIAYYLVSHDPHELTQIEGQLMFSVALPVALFAGVTAYGIHRSLLYPIIEFWFDSETGKTCRKYFPLVSTATIHTLLWRWNQGEEHTKLERKIVNEHFNTWADFIHLQFTSTLSIVLGAVVGRIVIPGSHSFYYPLVSFAALLFFSALVSNWRSHSVLDYVRDEANLSFERDAPKAARPSI